VKISQTRKEKLVSNVETINSIKKVPVEKRVKRDHNLHLKYKSWYERNYGKPNWGWGVHQTVAFGGNNTMGNLFPVPKELHYKITQWWQWY
jgi:hypothetical protein